jgi:hypothetical protein
LLKRWLHDAHDEGFQIVLLDGRALEEVGAELEREGLCDFRLGLYFICDSIVGARRTLGLASRPYDELDSVEKSSVDELVGQINSRNEADEKRSVQQLVRPAGVTISRLPEILPSQSINLNRPMYLIDTSSELSKEDMSSPVIALVARYMN